MRIVFDLSKPNGLTKLVLGVAFFGTLLGVVVYSFSSSYKNKEIKKQLEIEKNTNEQLKMKYRILKEQYDSLKAMYENYIRFHTI